MSSPRLTLRARVKAFATLVTDVHLETFCRLVCHAADPELRSDASRDAFMPHVIYKGIHYPIRPTETVLDGLIEGGADVRSSCRRGSCHTCLLQTDPKLVERLPKNRLPESLRAAGMFLPCITYCDRPMELQPPDWSTCFVDGVVAKKERLADGIVRLVLDVPPQWQWSAGQYVYLQGPNGESRPYSIASVRALDYYMELHVQRYEQGVVSRWAADDLRVHDVVRFRGPLGDCHYRSDSNQTPLLLLCTGTGAGAALAVAREAKLYGHQRSVQLVHGVRDEARLYLTRSMRELAANWPLFGFTCCCSGITNDSDVVRGHVTDVAFSTSRLGETLFLFGSPRMVGTAQERAEAQGIPRQSIHADAFIAQPSERRT